MTAISREHSLPEELVRSLRTYYRERLTAIEQRHDGNETHRRLVESSEAVKLRLIEAERKVINELYRSSKLEDEGRRRLEHLLDLEVAQIVAQRPEE